MIFIQNLFLINKILKWDIVNNSIFLDEPLVIWFEMRYY